MDSPILRFSLYVIGGGLVLAWLGAPEGLMRFGVILLWIVACAYLDSILHTRRMRRQAPKVVSINEVRPGGAAKGGEGAGGEKKRHQPIFSSVNQAEIETLVDLLRTEGLQPIMVSQNHAGQRGVAIFKIMLPEQELQRAKPVIDLFMAKATKTPS